MSPDREEIEVLYRDELCVVVAKPPGMHVHRTPQAGRDRVFVLQTLRDQLGRHLYPLHRLDRATSGVLAFAFSSDACRRLQERLCRADARKEYLVLTRGGTPPRWEYDYPLLNKSKVKQAARTAFERIGYFSRCSLLNARLYTGRSHQIRRHLARQAYQVLGDTSHGKGRINQFFRDNYGLPRMFLHARLLGFRHPVTEAFVRVEAPLPEDLHGFLLRLPDFSPVALEQFLLRSRSEPEPSTSAPRRRSE